jgi:hypothetical protein
MKMNINIQYASMMYNPKQAQKAAVTVDMTQQREVTEGLLIPLRESPIVQPGQSLIDPSSVIFSSCPFIGPSCGFPIGLIELVKQANERIKQVNSKIPFGEAPILSEHDGRYVAWDGHLSVLQAALSGGMMAATVLSEHDACREHLDRYKHGRVTLVQQAKTICVLEKYLHQQDEAGQWYKIHIEGILRDMGNWGFSWFNDMHAATPPQHLRDIASTNWKDWEKINAMSIEAAHDYVRLNPSPFGEYFI